MPTHTPLPGDTAEPTVLDRRTGPYGEVVLRKHGEHLQIIANGTFLMDTSDGRSERLLVSAALAELDAARLDPAAARPYAGREPGTPEPGTVQPGAPEPGYSVLIGGLGVGFSLAEAAAQPRWSRITVVEREEAVIDWHAPGGPLSGFSARALAGSRTKVVHAGLMAYLKEGGGDGPDSGGDGTGRAPLFDAVCLDVDNGPGWTVTEDNDSLYSPAGLTACAGRIAPGGVLAVWSAQPSRTFEESLADAGFARIRTEEITVARGVPDVVHFAIKPA